MDDHVDGSDQRVDGSAVQDVALLILGPRPSVRGRVEGPPRHPDDPVDLGPSLERLNG